MPAPSPTAAPDLSDFDRRVLEIAQRIDANDGYPSAQRIRRSFRASLDRIQESLARLKESGILAPVTPPRTGVLADEVIEQEVLDAVAALEARGIRPVVDAIYRVVRRNKNRVWAARAKLVRDGKLTLPKGHARTSGTCQEAATIKAIGDGLLEARQGYGVSERSCEEIARDITKLTNRPMPELAIVEPDPPVWEFEREAKRIEGIMKRLLRWRRQLVRGIEAREGG